MRNVNLKLASIGKKKLLYLYIPGLLFFLFAALFLGIGAQIGRSVNSYCKDAQHSYQGDCVEALINLVDDENASYTDRNHAIWALGQLGDRRSLKILRKYYNPQIAYYPAYDEGISEYELEKAINLVDGGFNATAFVWRD